MGQRGGTPDLLHSDFGGDPTKCGRCPKDHQTLPPATAFAAGGSCFTAGWASPGCRRYGPSGHRACLAVATVDPVEVASNAACVAASLGLSVDGCPETRLLVGEPLLQFQRILARAQEGNAEEPVWVGWSYCYGL